MRKAQRCGKPFRYASATDKDFNSLCLLSSLNFCIKKTHHVKFDNVYIWDVYIPDPRIYMNPGRDLTRSLLLTSHLVQVVVEVHIPCTQVPSQESGVRCEDCCHRNLARARQNEPRTCLPLMEVTNDIGLVSEVVC